MILGEGMIQGTARAYGKDNVRRLTTEEALELLDAEHKRGHVHTAWFKDVMHGRCFAMCNCCKCCCAGIEMMVHCNAENMVSSGFVASVKGNTCVSCGSCVRACPFNAIAIVPGVGAVVDDTKCMGCGVCAVKCSKQCLELKRDNSKADPLDVNELF